MKKSKFFVADLLTAILMAAGAVVYALANAKENSPIVIAALAVGAVVAGILLVKRIPYGEYIPFVLSLVGTAVFINLAFDEIGDILSKINLNGLSTSWIASAVLLVVSMICAAVTTVFAAKE